MGKFRSKLKGKSKGKRWQKGQSSNSNPKIQKYREMAKSRFFQENLGSTGLTQQAVSKHDAMMTYGHASLKKKSDAESELLIAKELENMSMKSGDDGSDTEYSGSFKAGTYKTFQTFASDWSQCSNVSFSKLLTRFDSNNGLHKEMLAVLAAVTEVIKEQGGKESTTEYFAALMETLKSAEMEENLVATLTLLSMGIKAVPQAVLRKQFSDSATIFTDILVKNEQSENGALLRSAIGCLSVLLRAQEYALWGDSSTMRIFESVLAFALHSKPKVRKAAQHAVTSVLRGSCFMIPSEDQKFKVPKLHPGSNRVAEYCLSQIKAEALLAGHRTVLHTLTMLRDVLPVFSKDYIKSICEAILSLMTHNNVYIKTCCLHTLHALFSSARDSSNMTASLAVQLTRALMAARPPANDTGQVLAWAAVLQQGFGCLANLDLNLCMPNLPAFVNICVTELWLSDVADINSASTNALKAVLLDCVKLALESDEAFIKHKSHIDAIFRSIGTGLDNPFNQAIRHVILTIAVCFEIGNEKVANSLGPLLKKLNDRRESHNFDNDKEVEYATGCAIKALGPEFVLRIIPLRDGPETINLERSWLLPVLKEKITNSNLKFFATEILEMATFCRKKSRELTQQKDVPGSHTYELLCNQFWALLPSFCNSPKDIKDNFKSVARVLGSVLKDNPEFRLSVMQALRKLISCSADNEDQLELGRFAKNYLPILLNIYMSPAKGSSAEGQRLAALETIQVYLTISEQTLREELFTNALQQLETSKDNHFQRESILDIIRALVLYQSSERIAKLFEEWVYPLCETVLEDPKKHKKAKKEKEMETEGENEEGDKKKGDLKYKEKAKLLEMEHKKAYRILEEIFKSDKESCKHFLKENYKKIKKLLMSSLNKVADSSKAARLRCIEHLINNTPFLNAESKLLKSAIAESVICTKDINSKCRQCAFNLINTVGNVLKTQEGGMQAFVNMLTSGLSAPLPRIISATLRAIASALFNYSEDMGLSTVQGLLETVVEHMTNTNREVIAAAMSFLKVYTKVLPNDVLAGSLPLIFKSLSSMPEDCKRHSRLEIGYFLTKMMRKFGADTVEKLIPQTDDVMLRRLRNLRKMDNRKKRQKENQRDQSDNDSDADMPIKGTSKTLEDILKDSDSDMEFMDEEEDRPKPKVKKTMKGRSQAWIQDDPENIVDLADVSASRKITATDPSRKQKASEVKAQKKKDGGFKTAPDGRLIITDDAFDDGDDNEPRPSGDIDTDTDDTDAEDEDSKPSKPSKLLKPGAKRRYDDILSVKSGKSGRSRASTVTVGSKYKAGGKGIHRPLGSAASVASAGTEYKSKKAKGDIKKQGKHDPYAYLPLSRKNLNKSLDLNLCMPNLPAFVNICVTELWLSDVADINSASTNALKAVLLDCVKLALESDEAFIKHKSHIDAIFRSIGTGLDNPFNQAIRHVILTIAVCFEIGNEKVANSLGPLLKKLNDRRESHNFDNDKEVEYATGCAIKALGPEFVLRIIPLRDGPETINLERSWLLPVLKEKITNSNLKFFATEILEMATFCRKKSRELTQQKDVPGSHTYELLCNQFWALLPSFCNSPKDIKDNFKSVARVLGSVLKDNPEFRLSVMQALRKLISCSADNEEDQLELGRFAKNYLPILLNIYMSPAKGSSAEGQRLAALETIQVYLTISEQTLREELFTNALQQLETSKDNHFQRESILDIIRALVLYQSSERIAKLFEEWVYPLCETVLEDPKKHKKAKKEKEMETEGENEEGDKKKGDLKYKEKVKLLEMEHKKAYRILEEIFKSDKESCKHFLKENYKKIKKLLMSSLNKVADSSKAARLRCIEHLINNTPFLNAESKLLKSAIAESVICTKDINSKCRQCAFNLINTVGNVLKTQEGGMQAFVNMLTSGLSAPLPRIISATLRAIASALFNYSENMGLSTVQGLLETVVEHMTNTNREVVAAAMSFLKVYTKVLPNDVLAGSLPLIFKSLSSMPEDCKRHSRLEIGYFLTKMMRKFGADTVEKLIPQTDDVMLRRLRNLRKMDNRKKRQKENQRDQSDNDSDADMPIKGTSKTLEDILKDSDSDMEFMDEEEDRPKPKVKKTMKGRSQAWIQDDPENIVDLADVSASRKITATDPSRKQKASEVKAQKKKDGGFKTAPDGRLIITDDAFDDGDDNEPRPSGDIDTDTDDTDAEDEDSKPSKPSKLLKPGAKRRYDDILSVKSGKSGRSRASTVTVGSKYKAGGKGIHRPLGSAASVASAAGTEYKSKKAKGDIKKQGKHDPYAYLPLSRKNLNKRKKAVTSKQFKGVVKSKTKGGRIKKK